MDPRQELPKDGTGRTQRVAEGSLSIPKGCLLGMWGSLTMPVSTPLALLGCPSLMLPGTACSWKLQLLFWDQDKGLWVGGEATVQVGRHLFFNTPNQHSIRGNPYSPLSLPE